MIEKGTLSDKDIVDSLNNDFIKIKGKQKDILKDLQNKVKDMQEKEKQSQQQTQEQKPEG